MLRSALAVLAAFALSSPVRAAGPYDDLLKHTSSNTNTIVLIDVKGAYASPLAVKEKWNEKGQPDNRGGLGFVPYDAEKVVIASEINLNTLTRDFQVGMVKMRNVPTMKDLAVREKGTADEIAGRLAVLSPRDVYYTTFSGTELVAVYPADRQYTARYLKAVLAGKTGQISPYLRKSADAAGSNTITIAVDLEDVVDRTLIKMSLPASPSVTKVKTVDVNLLATFLSRVKGLTFTAKVTDGISANIAVQFDSEAARFRKTLPDLFRELLEDQGVAINGFEKWEATFADNTMTLSGPLDTADLKRIVSLFSFPQPLDAAPDPMVKGDEPTVGATKRYLGAVDVILADVKKLKESPNYDKMATWHERAAAQIEQLNPQRADPLAVDAAFQAAKRLQAIAGSLRGVPIDVNALASQQYAFTQRSAPFFGGWYGRGWRSMIFSPGWTDTNIPQIQSQMSKVITDDQKRRQEVWSQIDQLFVEAKRKLADKYKTGF